MSRHQRDIKELTILLNAVENTNEAFVTIDQRSEVIFFNKAAERMFGYSREEVVGQDLGLILSAMCRDSHREAVGRYVATGEGKLIGHESELVIVRKSGATFPASISFSVSHINGEMYFTGIIRDLTARKEIEERLIQSERLAALGQTVAEINHEIKNPLIMIGGFARQLQRKAASDKDQAKLNIIVDEVERLENLLTDLGDLYRPWQLNVSDVSLNAMLSEVVDLACSTSDTHGVKVLFEPGEEVHVEVDREKMKQVLLNLVKNSIEATLADGEVLVQTKLHGRSVEVVVSDTGEGMPEEIRKRIFFPFFTTKEQGTGLGLCVSKRIVEDHPGCTFNIESIEGEGTTATINLCRCNNNGVAKRTS